MSGDKESLLKREEQQKAQRKAAKKKRKEEKATQKAKQKEDRKAEKANQKAEKKTKKKQRKEEKATLKADQKAAKAELKAEEKKEAALSRRKARGEILAALNELPSVNMQELGEIKNRSEFQKYLLDHNLQELDNDKFENINKEWDKFKNPLQPVSLFLGELKEKQFKDKVNTDYGQSADKKKLISDYKEQLSRESQKLESFFDVNEAIKKDQKEFVKYLGTHRLDQLSSVDLAALTYKGNPCSEFTLERGDDEIKEYLGHLQKGKKRITKKSFNKKDATKASDKGVKKYKEYLAKLDIENLSSEDLKSLKEIAREGTIVKHMLSPSEGISADVLREDLEAQQKAYRNNNLEFDNSIGDSTNQLTEEKSSQSVAENIEQNIARVENFAYFADKVADKYIEEILENAKALKTPEAEAEAAKQIGDYVSNLKLGPSRSSFRDIEAFKEERNKFREKYKELGLAYREPAPESVFKDNGGFPRTFDIDFTKSTNPGPVDGDPALEGTMYLPRSDGNYDLIMFNNGKPVGFQIMPPRDKSAISAKTLSELKNDYGLAMPNQQEQQASQNQEQGQVQNLAQQNLSQSAVGAPGDQEQNLSDEPLQPPGPGQNGSIQQPRGHGQTEINQTPPPQSMQQAGVTDELNIKLKYVSEKEEYKNVLKEIYGTPDQRIKGIEQLNTLSTDGEIPNSIEIKDGKIDLEEVREFARKNGGAIIRIPRTIEVNGETTLDGDNFDLLEINEKGEITGGVVLGEKEAGSKTLLGEDDRIELFNALKEREEFKDHTKLAELAESLNIDVKVQAEEESKILEGGRGLNASTSTDPDLSQPIVADTEKLQNFANQQTPEKLDFTKPVAVDAAVARGVAQALDGRDNDLANIVNEVQAGQEPKLVQAEPAKVAKLDATEESVQQAEEAIKEAPEKEYSEFLDDDKVVPKIKEEFGKLWAGMDDAARAHYRDELVEIIAASRGMSLGATPDSSGEVEKLTASINALDKIDTECFTGEDEGQADKKEAIENLKSAFDARRDELKEEIAKAPNAQVQNAQVQNAQANEQACEEVDELGPGEVVNNLGTARAREAYAKRQAAEQQRGQSQIEQEASQAQASPLVREDSGFGEPVAEQPAAEQQRVQSQIGQGVSQTRYPPKVVESVDSMIEEFSAQQNNVPNQTDAAMKRRLQAMVGKSDSMQVGEDQKTAPNQGVNRTHGKGTAQGKDAQTITRI